MKVERQRQTKISLSFEEIIEILYCNRTIPFDPEGCSFTVCDWNGDRPSEGLYIMINGK